LAALPLALRRAVLWRAMTEVPRGDRFRFGHVDAALV
jgi:hypothetical protein